MEKTLWHIHSRVLQGFYASDIYVAAADKAEAVANAMAAYDAYFEERMKEFGFFLHLNNWDDEDPDFEPQKVALRAQLLVEVEGKIRQIPGPGLVIIHN